MRRAVRTLAIAAIAAAPTVGGVAHAAPVSKLPSLASEAVPYPMDSTNQAGWWSPLAEYKGDTYFAFDAPADSENEHRIYLAKRDAFGAWSAGCLRAADGSCAHYRDDIGHHQPSIAIDGDGYIHAFVSMHGTTWRYYRSDKPASVTTLTNHSGEMPDSDAGVTYPTTTSTRAGDAYVIARVTSAETGAYGSGRLYRWSVRTASWTRVAVFASENGFSVYPDQLRSDRRGRVHILWEWASGGASGIRHLGSYLIYDPRKDRFLSAGRRSVQVPVTTEAPAGVVYQPLEGQEDKRDGTSSVDPGVQTAKLALAGAAARPGAVAYRYRPEPGGLFEIRWARWNGHEWTRQRLYAGDRETEAAIGATVHGHRARAYYTVNPPMCDPGNTATGGLFVAEKRVHGARPSSGEWAVRLLDSDAGILRLATATRRDGTDVLYLAAPNVDDPPASRLYFATLPRRGRAASAMADLHLTQDETNWAYDADVTVSSALTPQSGGKCAVDGNLTDRNSRWISARGDETPTMEIKLPQPVEIRDVDVYSGYFADSRAIVRDFTVELLIDGEWRSVGGVSDNTSNPAVVDLDAPGATDRLRLVLTDPSGYEGGSDLARIFEVEVHGEAVSP